MIAPARGFAPPLLMLWLVLGCAGNEHEPAAPPAEPSEASVDAAPPRQVSPTESTPPSRAMDDWTPATHREVVLRRQNLVLSLPHGDRWEIQSTRGTWSGLRDEKSDSEIWVRHTVARRTVTVQECERQARLSWPVIRDTGPGAVERRLQAPAGYGGRLSVVLLPDGGGRVEAFSVGVSRCLAVVFSTGSQPGFPVRLRAAVNDIIEQMRVPNISERGHLRRMD